VIATHFHLSFDTEVAVLRCTLIVGPIVAYWLTRHICLGLQARDRDLVRHGVETGRLFRRPDGGYAEVREPLSAGERWRLSAAELKCAGGHCAHGRAHDKTGSPS
jgi:quinol---cytochrome-c reductase cytochrome b subunit